MLAARGQVLLSICSPFRSGLLPICSPEHPRGNHESHKRAETRGITSPFPGSLVSRASLLLEREPVTQPNRKSPANRAYSEASPGSEENVKAIGAPGFEPGTSPTRIGRDLPCFPVEMPGNKRFW
jgi:hypothetical protein